MALGTLTPVPFLIKNKRRVFLILTLRVFTPKKDGARPQQRIEHDPESKFEAQPLFSTTISTAAFLALLSVIDFCKLEKDYKEVDESLAAIEVLSF